MKTDQARLNNIIGQLEGVKKMMAADADCLKVLTQLKAIRSAVGGVMDSLVEAQFDTCLRSVSHDDKQLLVKIKKYVKSN